MLPAGIITEEIQKERNGPAMVFGLDEAEGFLEQCVFRRLKLGEIDDGGSGSAWTPSLGRKVGQKNGGKKKKEGAGHISNYGVPWIPAIGSFVM